MGKYFGTDGIRGRANDELTGELAYKTGRAAAKVLGDAAGRRPRVLIGMDTRRSGDMLAAALTAGLCAVGADVTDLGVAPTPAVAYLTVSEGADAGIVISASHNPSEYNGIKIFGGDGYKLNDALEEAVEKLIDSDDVPNAAPDDIGRVSGGTELLEKYENHVISCGDGSLAGMKIVFDCANGAASRTARAIFSNTGAECVFIHDAPDGLNINAACGSTHLDSLRRAVVGLGFDVGVAFDGDADRCLVVDERGEIVNGDRIIAVLGRDMRERGLLPHDTVTVTVLSNLGLHEFCAKNGISVAVTAVGDRSVLEEMLRSGCAIGGEQSGHVILTAHATTGDGELTAVKYLGLLNRSGLRASELSGEIVDFPQVMVNVTIDNAVKKTIAETESVKAAIAEAERELGTSGRILVRPSGTEPLVRVMVECRDSAQAKRLADSVAAQCTASAAAAAAAASRR